MIGQQRPYPSETYCVELDREAMEALMVLARRRGIERTSGLLRFLGDIIARELFGEKALDKPTPLV